MPMPKLFLELQRRNTFSDSEVETLFFFVTTSIVSELSKSVKKKTTYRNSCSWQNKQYNVWNKFPAEISLILPSEYRGGDIVIINADFSLIMT